MYINVSYKNELISETERDRRSTLGPSPASSITMYIRSKTHKGIGFLAHVINSVRNTSAFALKNTFLTLILD